MKGIMAYAAKRALFAMLAVQSQPGFALEDVQVTYRAPVEPSDIDLFGGPVRFVQVEVSGEPGRAVVEETVSVMVLVRVSDEGADVADTDVVVERVVDVLADILDNDPFIGEGQTMQLVGFASGQGEYDPSRAFGVSTLGLEVQILCLMT